MLKNVFKGAANAAAAKAGPLKELYDRCVAGGVRKEMAKLTLARKIAAIVLRLWKKGALGSGTQMRARRIVSVPA